MNKIDDVLNAGQLYLEQLTNQYIQEQAMKEVLPIRFEKNMKFLQENLPKLYHQFKNYKPQRAFEFFCNENGIPNLRWLDTKDCFYSVDPYEQAKKQVDQVLSTTPIIKYNLHEEHDPFYQQHLIYLNKLVSKRQELEQKFSFHESITESIPLCLIFGVGLGYHFSYLYERVTPANIYIFEPDCDLFYASLFTFDWFDLLAYVLSKNLGVHFFLGQEPDDIILDLRAAQTFNAPFISSYSFGYIHYFSDKINNLRDRLSKEFYLLSMGWGFFDDNLFSLSHSIDNIKNNVHFLRSECHLPLDIQNIPVFVVANGPSLDFCIETIRHQIDKIIVVACGTAITALYKAGIKPDIYIAVERVSVVPDSLLSIPDLDYLKDILLIAPDVLHPDCRRFFNKKIYGLKGDEPTYKMLAINTDVAEHFKRVSYINPLVGNAGVSFPLHIGFKNIYLCGADNGYKDPMHHHSKLSMYYQDDGNTQPHYQDMELTKGKLTIPGNLGGVVITNQLFKSCVMMMEVALSHFPNAKCHNCSDGAYIKGTQPQRIDEIDFTDFAIVDKHSVIDCLYNDISQPIAIEIDDIHEFMDYEFFTYFINKLKSEWQNLSDSRLGVMQMMQTQMEYLTQISKSKQAHMWNVCFGSFSTMFSFITVVLYSIPDEQESLLATREMSALVLEFFDKMDALYQNGLQMIQGRHLKI